MEKRRETLMKQMRFILCMIIVVALILSIPAESSAAAKFNQKTTVKSIAVENSSFQKVKLTWKKTPGATGYQIYRATSKNGRYKKIATTSKRTITNKVVLGKTYYYRIRAYKKQGIRKRYTRWSSPKKITSRLNRPTMTIKRSVKYGEGQRNRISWKKVSGATKYEVYKSSSAKGKYTKIATTKKLYVIDKDVKTAKTYYYKVRACRIVKGKSHYSYYSKPHVHDWEKSSISMGLVECRAHYVNEGKAMFFMSVEDHHLHQADRECGSGWGEGFHYAACKYCTKCNQIHMIDHVHDFDTVEKKVYMKRIRCECGMKFGGGDGYTATENWKQHVLIYTSHGYPRSEHDTYTETTDSWAIYYEAAKTCSCGWRPIDPYLKSLRKLAEAGYEEIVDVVIDGTGGHEL